MNLSTKSFTKYEYKLLNKNLSFGPRPNQFNRMKFNKDPQAFFRRIELKAHFADNTRYESTEEERFGPERDSTWASDKMDHTVEHSSLQYRTTSKISKRRNSQKTT